MKLVTSLAGGLAMSGLLLWVSVSAASLATVYVAQTAAGSADGSSCANSRAATFFNTAGNWGAGAAQIGQNTTVHLCGTISTALTAQGSGAASNVITILFETGAKISMGTCNTRCLDLSGQSYIVVDGGSNGIIESTTNGTGLSTQNNDSGVYAAPGSHLEIKNLTVRNSYVYTCCGSDGTGRPIFIIGGTNTLIHHNTVHDGRFCIDFTLGAGVTPSSGNQIYNNTIYNCSWAITYADGDGTTSDSGAVIHDNDWRAQNLWCTGSSDIYHNDGLHVFTQASAGTITNLNIYNNYAHGDVMSSDGVKCYTALIKISPGVSPANLTANVFNNLMVITNGATSDGYIAATGNATYGIYNNTMDSTAGDGASQTGLETNSGAVVTMKNNILNAVRFAMYVLGTGVVTGTNTNDYYYTSAPSFYYHGPGFINFAQWQSQSGADATSITSNPNLNGSYVPNVGSPVIVAGTNLTSLAIAALNTGKPSVVGVAGLADGISRPDLGSWDLGASPFFVGGGGKAPARRRR